ncbi:type II secretion system protein [Deinococcus soli (ex Cha et al. 2016)]|uniref:Prepilin-type N-terminal cleavage/methylation domain-containing protein n=2 Tax=Deinococcus soli (ex Cha et al. 2016) TaxID=1309411 RepID=A0AAE3XFE0_9DEIO|nr:type II secretion system protein [Deinococcus soli (ex Cha et al. 2016)]MDR6218713.1 prepilin-type N-terminal cleavage/methylation domain-containing protein [Deinococcus soli (ex Cha et al. 2016)]MDR6328510.1 prepilin-type N-terminal cleavage/methylation domain-containing protein [Deinococcus soli (ex Cha et al. 2016)]MDR6753121.1 prepilin-type N-terminal cleavage/methylation domain-containing protein [Deinococcus soli (ex Cha et al. 2016)]
MNRTSGFTLIELLVVIAVIGILAAVLISNVNSARARAYDTQALSCARELQVALDNQALDTPNPQQAGIAVANNRPRTCTSIRNLAYDHYTTSGGNVIATCFAVSHPKGTGRVYGADLATHADPYMTHFDPAATPPGCTMNGAGRGTPFVWP